MLEVKVTITLEQKLLNMLEGLLCGKVSVPVKQDTETIKEDVKKEVATNRNSLEKKENKKEEIKQEEKVVEQEDDPSITIAEIRTFVKPIIKEKREEVKGLLSEFNASNISALQQKDYCAFYEKVKELM